MLHWLFVEWCHRLFGGWVIPRDARHRYIGRAGVAYEIDVGPVAGLLNIVEVTLRGDADFGGVIRHTALPGLTVMVAPTSLRVAAALRYLLAEADRQSRQQMMLANEFTVAVAPEPVMSPETLDELADRLTTRVVDRVTSPSSAEELVDE